MKNKKFMIIRYSVIVLSFLSLIYIYYCQNKVITEEEKKIDVSSKITEDILIDASKIYISSRQDYYADIIKNDDYEIRINTDDLVESKLIDNNDDYKGYVKVINDDFSFVKVDNMLLNNLNSKDYVDEVNNGGEAYDLKKVYKGLESNNYFKYNDKIYRIIGITNSNDLKVIDTENTLSDYWGLSGDINYLKSNEEYQDDGYKGIFYVGFVRNKTTDIDQIIKNEKRNNTYTTVVPKVYSSYSYASLSDIILTSKECEFDKITDINIDTCDSFILDMLSNTYLSITSSNNKVYFINDKKSLETRDLEKNINIKRVRFISLYESYAKGNGTINEPYEISEE